MDDMTSSMPQAPEASGPEIAPQPATAEDRAMPDSRFSVPITIELESTIVPLAKLQGMREGSVLPLDTSAGAIPVRILASGKPFARGSLVSVGDGYGVLIEAG